MPAVFEFPHCVSPHEIDGVGHVNNIEYLRWLQDAAVAHSTAQGWPASAYHRLGQGWVVRTHFIEYLLPAFADDNLLIRTWVADMKRVTSLRRYEILRPSDGKTLAVASTNWAFVNFATLQLCRVPADITSAFELVADSSLIGRRAAEHQPTEGILRSRADEDSEG